MCNQVGYFHLRMCALVYSDIMNLVGCWCTFRASLLNIHSVDMSNPFLYSIAFMLDQFINEASL